MTLDYTSDPKCFKLYKELQRELKKKIGGDIYYAKNSGLRENRTNNETTKETIEKSQRGIWGFYWS